MSQGAKPVITQMIFDQVRVQLGNTAVYIQGVEDAKSIRIKRGNECYLVTMMIGGDRYNLFDLLDTGRVWIYPYLKCSLEIELKAEEGDDES